MGGTVSSYSFFLALLDSASSKKETYRGILSHNKEKNPLLYLIETSVTDTLQNAAHVPLAWLIQWGGLKVASVTFILVSIRAVYFIMKFLLRLWVKPELSSNRKWKNNSHLSQK